MLLFNHVPPGFTMHIDPTWTLQQTTAALTDTLRHRWGEDRARAISPRVGLVAGWLHELSRHPVPAIGPEPDFIAQGPHASAADQAIANKVAQ